ALPFRGLLQQVMPGDLVVMRRIKPAIADRAAYRFVEVANEAPVPGKAGDDREVALRHAESQVDPAGIAPFGDDPAAAQHEAVRAAARAHRTERLVPWRLFAKIAGDHPGEVAAPRRLVLSGVPCRGGDPCGFEAGLLRFAALPCWMRRRDIGHRSASGCCGLD